MATWTLQEYEALKAAVASGVHSVSYDGPPSRTVTYHSLSEMRELLKEMEETVFAPPCRVTTRYASFRKGFR